ncbi:WxL domain-containing protein [Lactobacillus sp. DCY120]|uniref:WxL domain-containing protein n=1 Tax=Bombilactobacillus apium TaxID=2675299 RepID=A0A850R3D5_9LACO|nr:WxL domain-containing protein [Bombilactobacillus apium]NVY96481.1 WxL domain-containing protein [Bombilactobacillus apium]
MKTMKFKSMANVAAILGTVLISTPAMTAMAAPTTPASTASSDVTLELTAPGSDDKQTSKDPTTGEEGTDKDDNGNTLVPGTKPTDNAGPLTINGVPRFEFGKIAFSGSKQTVKAIFHEYDKNGNMILNEDKTPKKVEGAARKPSLQVSDLRGTGAGWNVTASLSAITNQTSGSTDKLTSPQLSFAASKTIGTNGVQKEASTSASVAAPTLTTPIVLNVDDESNTQTKTVFNAAAHDEGKDPSTGAGLGQWFANFDPDSITLAVYPGATAGQYKGTVTWNLSSGPAA